MKEISFYPFSKLLVKKYKLNNPEHYVGNLEEYIRLNNLYEKSQNGRFFINVTVQYTESTKRGKYFNYIDHKYDNCFVKVFGNEAQIFTDKNNLNNFIIKKVTGKYFQMFGKEVTLRIYENRIKKL